MINTIGALPILNEVMEYLLGLRLINMVSHLLFTEKVISKWLQHHLENPYNLEITGSKEAKGPVFSHYKCLKLLWRIEHYSLFELLPLRDNPVISPIINNLVFIGEDLDTAYRLLSDEGLLDYSGNEIKLDLAKKFV